MSAQVKNRVMDLAKDFGTTDKEIMDAVGKYSDTPKTRSQQLTDSELTIVFEHMTQTHQISSLAEVFVVPEKPKAAPAAKEPAKAPAPAQKPQQAQKAAVPAQREVPAQQTPATEKAAPVQQAQKQQAAPAQKAVPAQQAAPAQKQQAAAGQRPQQPTQNRPQQNGQRPQQNGQRPQQPAQNRQQQNGQPRQQTAQQGRPQQAQPARPQQTAQQARPQQAAGQTPKQPKQDKPHTPKKVPEKKVVDTRGSANTNLSKYDEKFDQMAGDRADKMRRGKEKIGNKNRQRQGGNQGSGAKRRQEERNKMQRLQLEIAKRAPLRVQIPDEISVQELAVRMKKTGAEVVRKLVGMGVMASLSDTIDYDTAALVAMEFNCKIEHEVVVTVEERLIDDHVDTEDELKSRAPVVVVMGHVDHGKTSLLDYIRKTKVAAGEAGGITQAIGAYVVDINGSPVTFLDTPGHEAFTSMRARGAMVTDIAILVVAATEGIKPQTVESISHAKAANIPIVVAINKMDMPGANPEAIKQQLTQYDLVPEEWGGDVIVCPISAKTGQGIDDLLESLVLQAEVLELRANPDRAASGAVLEARLDKGRGPIMTVLVQNGTLHQGDIIIAGTSVGRVRTMINDKGQRITEAGPSVPVEIAGMSEVPNAGDVFNAVSDERMARELVEERKAKARLEASGAGKKVSLDDLFARIQEGEMKDFNIIVKADVKGSAEAVKASLEKLGNEEVRVRVIHSGVGAINESDVMLASTSNALIVGFNVRPDNTARDSAVRADVEIRMYRVIYDCINEIEAAMKGMLAPKFEEKIIGHVEVRQTYKVSKVGTVCGGYVLDGKVQRGCKVRVLRDNIVLFEGELASLRRFKDDVREVATGYECGLQVEKYNDIKELDIIECFVMEQINA